MIPALPARPLEEEGEFAEVLLLPAQPMTPLAHASTLAAFVELRIGEGRIAVAVAALRALRKLLASAEAADGQREAERRVGAPRL